MSKNLNYILQELAGGGYSDWDKLDNYIEEYNLDSYNIVENAKEFSDYPKFNDLMYSTLVLGFEKMREKVLNTIKSNEWKIREEIIEWIKNADSECYINYLDSFIETPVFRDYDMRDLDYDNMVAKFIADVWEEIK